MHAVIFDCDNTFGLPRSEIDDGLTLLYLLGRSDIDLLGVTTTFGNGSIDKVYAATTRQLHTLGRDDIPVFKGEGMRGQAPTEAAHFLAETAAAHPGKVTVLATGPVGNLRAAADLDPDFYSNLKQIACMGGYLHDLHLGWRNLPELNLSADPEAAFDVLNAPRTHGCRVTLMNAHLCLQASFGWPDLRRATFWDRATRRIVRNWLLLFGLYCGIRKFYLWDLLPAVYISHSEFFAWNPTTITATVADLETGMLKPVEARGWNAVNMPSLIIHPGRFREVLFKAWERTAKSPALKSVLPKT